MFVWGLAILPPKIPEADPSLLDALASEVQIGSFFVCSEANSWKT